MITKLNRSFLYVAVATNLMLAWMLLVKLRVSPSDVMLEVKSSTADLESRYATTAERLEALQTTVDSRAAILKAMDSECARRAEKMLDREAFAQWANKARELNPDLNIPVVSADAEQ